MKLNAGQKQAVEHGEGPALVVAGAGTGKTTVIVERIVRLIDSGVDRKSILALTFTEKAAQEMRDRVADRLDGSYGIDLNIFTFNAFGQEMLREFASEIGISPNLQVIGDLGKVVLLRDHIDELELDYFSPVTQPDAQLGNLANYFSLLKQQLVTPDDLQKYATKLPSGDDAEKLEKLRFEELAKAYSTYVRICRQTNLVDYDDQIYLLCELLTMRPNIAKQLQERYSYLLVDEFQDTNPMQSAMLDLLIGAKQNIMAVGDDDQSIYGWRGATLANILNFKKKYSRATEITLTDNYRSSQAILDQAYRLIQHNNPNRLEAMNGLNKKLISHMSNGAEPALQSFHSLDQEINWIARDIISRIEEGEEPGNIAVLTRRNYVAQKVAETLAYYDVDHVLAGIASDLYKEPVVASLLEALIAIDDIQQNTPLYHTLVGPIFNSDQTLVSGLSAKARREKTTLWSLITSDDGLAREVELMQSWQKEAHELSVGALAYKVIDESGLKDSLYRDAERDEAAAYAVKALGQWFATLREFQQVSAVASVKQYVENLDTIRSGNETISDTEVFESNLPVVMSVHRAKGLEWDTVYIADCTEYSFPLRQTRQSLEVPESLRISAEADDHFAEERRLMYVAMTRARKQLTLSHAETRTGTTKRKPSRFLEEIFGDDLPGNLHSEQIVFDFALPQNRLGKKISLPSTMKDGNKIILSASQANDFLRCPLDFYYRHILQVPSEPNPASALGTAFHDLIHKIHAARIAGSKPPSKQILLEELESQWPREGYMSLKQRDRAIETAERALSETYDRLMVGPIPLESEKPFRITVPGGKVVLTGRIDAVFPGNKGVEIVDYKTSASATNPEKAKSRTSSSKQLEMYALAWREMTGEMPAQVSLDFVQTDQKGTVTKREKTIQNLASKLSAAADDILQGTFEPGNNHNYCRHPSL